MTLEFLNLPKKSIHRQFIPKKVFYNHGDLTTAEKNLFVNNLDRITLYAQLTRENTNIAVYKDDGKTYEEVPVFLLELRNKDKLDRIAQIIMESIPYPMILIAKDIDRFCFYAAHQRDNLVDQSKIILDKIYKTDFIEENHDFIKKISYENLNKMNFYQLYDDYIQRVIEYNLHKRNIKNISNQSKILAEIEKKEEKISLLKNTLKKEKHFNKKLELNIEIKKIEKELKQMEANND